MSPSLLASTIDCTSLEAHATLEDVQHACDKAIDAGFASVCVNGIYLKRVVEWLAGAKPNVAACGVAGFPLGAMKPTVKAIEATSLVKDGAHAIDFVAHLPHVMALNHAAVMEDFLRVTTSVRSVSREIGVKVIVESAALMANVDAATGEARVALACEAAAEAGCDFVQTSTGFHPAGGATIQAVKLLKKHAPNLKVKASGGIETRDDALALLDAGANRLGVEVGALGMLVC